MTSVRWWAITTAAVAMLLTGCTPSVTPSGPATPTTDVPPGSAPASAPTPQSSAAITITTATATSSRSTATAPDRNGPPTPTLPPITTSVVSLAPGVSDEASGIAPATGALGAFFLVDDATGTDSVDVVTADGALLARIAVEGMSAANAEAMASGTCGPVPLPGPQNAESCLYVGDIGDNAARRADIAVFRFGEPDLTDIADEPVAADEWRYTYPDGPHNAEAMILTPDGSLLVVTKPATGSVPHRMYRASPGGGQLAFVREFRPPDAQRPLRTLLTGNLVTDLAATPGRVLLLTYDEVQEFTAPGPDADAASFPDWPHRRLPLPWLTQAEAVTGAADGCGYAVASEAGPGGGSGSIAVMTCD